jgi:site-specific recombinase XerD
VTEPHAGTHRAVIDQIAYERGLSPNTRAAYARDLSAFADFIDECGGTDRPQDLTRERSPPFLKTSVRAACLPQRGEARRGYAVFFAFLCSEGVVSEDVTAVMDAPRKGRGCRAAVRRTGARTADFNRRRRCARRARTAARLNCCMRAVCAFQK